MRHIDRRQTEKDSERDKLADKETVQQRACKTESLRDRVKD